MNRSFIGLANYQMLATNSRFLETIPRTLYFTILSIIAPVILGMFAAEVFHQRFPLRGLLRGIYVLPMMTTPVAIALVFIMMYHPQLGILNYLLSLLGIPPQLWIYDRNTVIAALVLVETWQWTPLVMLIVLGGLAALPTEPYESALIDGASRWDMYRYITLPLVMPFLMVAVIIRAIDAIKSFDIIFVMTQGGPGTASETINIYLYLQAFSFFNIGHASAVVVVFFVIIVALAAVLLAARERLRWTR
jgi:multiple sugar transport system permease protein